MAITFDYKVRDRHGALHRGKLDAETVPLAAGRLRQMGYLPVEIKATSAMSIDLKKEIEIPGLSNRVKLRDVAVVSRQLATMVAAGLTLVRALRVLADQVSSKPLSAALAEIRTEVEKGSSFSSALEQHPKIFSKLYVAMVRAGEASGQLDAALLKLADQTEKQVELRAKVRSAFTYPCVVVVVVVLVITAMMIFVVPTFTHLYATLHGTLPFPTRVVIGISHIVTSIWLLVLIAAIVLAVVGLRRALRTAKGREIWDRLKLRPPVFGPLAHKIALSRLANTLSSLLGSGLGVIEALSITAENVGNSIVASALTKSQASVRNGESLSRSLSEHPVVPAMVTQMVEAGEESGTVGDMLAKVASFYDNEVSTTVGSLTAILEPAMIVFMGLCIGFIVVSLYMPMFNYVKLMQGGAG